MALTCFTARWLHMLSLGSLWSEHGPHLERYLFSHQAFKRLLDNNIVNITIYSHIRNTATLQYQTWSRHCHHETLDLSQISCATEVISALDITRAASIACKDQIVRHFGATAIIRGEVGQGISYPTPRESCSMTFRFPQSTAGATPLPLSL